MKEKLCDTCQHRNNVEQLKPCIIYRDNCEYYEKERGDMKAIIQIDVPDHQIGQEVNIYFKDTMMIKGIVQEPCGETVSLEAFKQVMWERDIAIQQLHDLGYDFGEQIPAVQAVPIDVLDKIRAEIFNACSDSYHMPVYKLSCEEIFEIIDKYQAESEDKE